MPPGISLAQSNIVYYGLTTRFFGFPTTSTTRGPPCPPPGGQLPFDASAVSVYVAAEINAEIAAESLDARLNSAGDTPVNSLNLRLKWPAFR